MMDFRQTNEPFYYNSDQIQKTDSNQLRDVEERHGELRHLETDIVHLHEIHRDFAGLVSEQGEMIDDIESNVTQTETQVNTGVKVLRQAVSLQSAVRRKYIICGLITFILVIIIVITVTVIVVNNNKK